MALHWCAGQWYNNYMKAKTKTSKLLQKAFSYELTKQKR
jgi:hypothetical protein